MELEDLKVGRHRKRSAIFELINNILLEKKQKNYEEFSKSSIKFLVSEIHLG